MNLVLGAIVSYLLGSIPSAYIYGKYFRDTDIRQQGSGNVGASNVFRVLGKKAGIIVLISDILKGVIAVVLVGDLFGLDEVLQRLLLAVCVVGGHNWTIFLKFKGGKGIATSLGVLIGLTIKIPPLRTVLLVTILVWIIIFLSTRIVSVASIAAATSLPVIMVLTGQTLEMVCLGIIFCIFVVVRHRSNLQRLFKGQEPSVKLPFGKKNK